MKFIKKTFTLQIVHGIHSKKFCPAWVLPILMLNSFHSIPFLRDLLESNSNLIIIVLIEIRCGQRSGYMEAVNIDPAVKAQIYKLASILLCPNTVGQILVIHIVFRLIDLQDEFESQSSSTRRRIFCSLC
jgi:hypothetical protein